MRLLTTLHLAVGMLCSAAARIAEPVVDAVDRVIVHCVEFLLSAFAADKPVFAVDGPDLIAPGMPASLDPSMLERLRHEKGQPRLGSARGI